MTVRLRQTAQEWKPGRLGITLVVSQRDSRRLWEGEGMPPLVLQSVLKKFLIVLSCAVAVCSSATLALAQHPGVRTGGVPVHTPGPPISRVPISSAPMRAPIAQAPIVHAPIIRAPVGYAPINTARSPMGPSANAIGVVGFRPPWHPIRRFPPTFIVYQSGFFPGGTFWGSNSCWWATCDLFWSWPIAYTTVSSPGPTNYVSPVYENTVYVYGEEREDFPQLFLKDGTILSVTDYWVVDGQLHFTMTEGNGMKPAEHVIPFDALDLQTTVDANTQRGFRFMLRNEPFEQYVRDHPEGPPPIVKSPRE